MTLTCARGTHRVQMPENILGALFHITKPYAAIVGDNAAATWTRRVSSTLAGQTLGILGLGAIGQELARKASALEMRVIGTRRAAGSLPHVDRVYTPAETDEVLAQSDFVVLLLPATPETENIINAARLSRMKKTAWLLNFGRGALIDDAALVAAAKAGTIAGAVLDVFRQEPLPKDDPFWGTENILVLPHIGGLHPARDSMVAALLVENLRRFLDGAPLKEVVDRKAGY
jgi:phosphoglycerate dehydrogenase-like enzyme